MTTISTVTTKYVLDTSQLDRASKSASNAVRQSSQQILKSVKSVSIGFGVMSAAALAAATVIVSSNLDSIDALAKTADKLRINITELQGLQRIAELSGSTVGVMNGSLEKMSKRLGEAAQGGGAAASALDELNLNVSDLQRLSPHNLFKTYAEAIGNVNDRGEQLALISKLMGDESRSLIGVIDAGTVAIDESTQKMIEYGAAINRVDAAKIEMTNDALTDMKTAAGAAGTQLTIALAPILTVIADNLTDATSEASGFKDEMGSMSRVAITAITGIISFFAQTQIKINTVALGIKLLKVQYLELVVLDKKIANVGTFGLFGSDALKEAKSNLNDAKNSVQELAIENERLAVSSDEAKDKFLAQLAAVEEAARKVADAKNTTPTGPDTKVDDISAPVDDISAPTGPDNSSAIAANFQRLKDSQKSEIELENDKYQSQLDAANAFFVMKQDLTTEDQALLEQLEQQHVDKVNAIKRKADDKDAQYKMRLAATVGSTLSSISNLTTQLASSGSKKQKAAAKVVARTSIAVNTASAIMKTLSIMGPILGPVAAVGIAAKGASELQKVNSARQKGGGVNAGDNVLVGENGPEVIQVGARSAFVVPNERLSEKSGSISQVFQIAPVFNVSTIDARGTASWFADNKDVITDGIVENIRDAHLVDILATDT